jgi:dethiobiotin synthetase
LNRLLIAGTAAGSGKTLLTQALSQYTQRHGQGQPFSCLTLCPSTALTGVRPSNGVTAGALPPEHLWPLLAQQSPDELCLIDSPGSLGSPLTPETTLADLAWDWRLPTVLVVPIAAETIDQAVAFAALARQARVALRGLVLNCRRPCSEAEQSTWANPKLLSRLTGVPVLGTLPYLEAPEQGDRLIAAAASLCLEALLPPQCWTPVIS